MNPKDSTSLAMSYIHVFLVRFRRFTSLMFVKGLQIYGF